MRLGVTYHPEMDCMSEKLCQLADVLELSHAPHPSWWEGPFTHHLVRTAGGQRVNLLDPGLVSRAAADYSIASSSDSHPLILSVHLGYPCAIQRTGAHNYPISPVVSEMTAVARFSESLGFLRSLYSGKLAVENLDYHEGGAYEHICSPGFITTFLENNRDVDLLLDISHAQVSAIKLAGADARHRLQVTQEYLSQLPLDRIVEIHLCAPVVSERNIADTEHAPVTDIELRLFEELLLLPQLHIVILECTTKVIEQLKVISEMMKPYRKSKKE